MKSSVIINPRYEETDQMGIIYHGNYFTWFEVARSKFFKDIGYSYRDLESENVILPVIDVGCTYIKPAHYDVDVRVETEIYLFKGVKFGLKYSVFENDTNLLLAHGYTLHGFVDKEMKPINIKKKNKKVFDIISNSFEGVK
ncbi:MAG: acyl-CoA thioesterase [Clostridiales bacterium]|nr:acyl-CoA thioesterase [Clostridiales bacterium]